MKHKYPQYLAHGQGHNVIDSCHLRGLNKLSMHFKYESPASNGSKIMTMVNVFYVGQSLKKCYEKKCLITRNAHVKYESPA